MDRRRYRTVIATAALVGGAALAACAPSNADPAASSADRCAISGPPGDGWTLTWSDEFDGDAVDATKWQRTMDFPGRRGGRQHNSAYGSYVLDENAVVADGVLRLIAAEGPVVGDDPPGEFPYSQGFLSSHDLFHQAYGYWEICARFPPGKGIWPAFWLLPQDRSWPPEFDIAEWWGGYESEHGMGAMHQGLASRPGGRGAPVRWDSEWIYGPEPAQGWHSWGLEWEPGRAAFYHDGRVTLEITGDVVPDQSMYIVLNSGTCTQRHADRGCPPDASTVFPNAFEIDYVRVYRR